MREKIRQVAKLRDLYYRIGLLVFMISLGVVLVSSSLSNAGDVAQILKVSGIDKDGALLLSIETDKPFKDCKILDQKDKTHLRILLEGVGLDGRMASVPLQSSYLKRVVMKSHERGVLITGDPQTEWEGFTINKEGNTVYVRIYPSTRNAANQNTSYNDYVKNASFHQGYSSIPVADKGPLYNAPAGGGTPAIGTEGMIEQPKVYSGKPISLDLVDADIKNVIRLIADLTGMNIVVDPDVTGKITLKVEQVPWDQVLDMILKVNGLGTEQAGDVLRIARKEKLRKELEEQKALVEARKKLIEEQMNLEKSKKNVGVLETHYLTVNYADMEVVKRQIENTVKSSDGKVELDPRTRTIIYTDYAPRIEDAKRLIAMLDKPLLQVLLEARVVTATSNFARSLGVDWGFNYKNIGDTTFNPDNPKNKATSYTPGFAINNTPATTSAPLASTLGFGWQLLRGRDLFSIDMSLKLGEKKGSAKLVSSPKVHTLNNQQAKISQGLEIPYTVQGRDQEPTTEFKEAKLELNVTPSVTPDKRILLDLSVEKSDPDFSVVSAKGEPSIKRRAVTTKILVEDGSIVVLGGVLEESMSTASVSTPGMSKIPILGNLFKSKDVKVEKNELLIFIRPKIIELPQVQLSAQ
jgi:type IV pilus assembly protein PilQ